MFVGRFLLRSIGFIEDIPRLWQLISLAFLAVVIGAAVAAAFSRIPLKPLRKIAEAADRLAAGDFSARINLKMGGELQELNTSFNNMANELEQSQMLRSDFINNFSHEFKTPISSISLAAQMLNDPTVRKSPEMMQKVSTVITDETKRLRFQVEKVLQMSMFDRQKATLRIEEVDANVIIYNVVNTFKLKVEQYGGSLTANLDAMDAIVNVDEMHFTNVIFNLLDNAVKYRSDERPLDLTVSTDDQGEDNLRITIADNGIGIRKDDLKKIFEKFYRVSTGNRHDVKGFGLGLAYVHKLIGDMGGSISVESEFNHGTKFIITLPLSKN